MTPLFIGACPRSGTTLLGSLLGAHSRSVTIPESPFKIYPLAYAFGRNGNRLTESMLQDLVDHWRFRIWNVPLTAGDLVAFVGDSTWSNLFEHLVLKYAAVHGRGEFDLWIDHTPSNVRHAEILLRSFPQAKFIHLVRDGRATAASALKLDWGPNTARAAARWWTAQVSSGLLAESGLPRKRVLRVRYEELVGDPAATLTSICEFVGCRFEPQLLEGNGFDVPAFTAGQHRLVGQAPQTSRIEAWKQELTPSQIECFEYYAGSLLEHLGYRLEHLPLPRAPRGNELWRMEMSEFLHRAVNKVRSRLRRARHVST